MGDGWMGEWVDGWMKTDSLFYQLFQAEPGILFELMGRSASDAQHYEFRSVELKQTAFRIDGVLLPTILPTSQPVYFVEVQFQLDPFLYHRFFAELFLYLSQHPKTYDWQGVLIYPRRSLRSTSSHLYRLLLESSQVMEVYLDEMGEMETLPLSVGVAKLVIEPEATAPEQARRLIARAKRESGSTYRDLINLVETIIVYKFTRLSRDEVIAMLGLREIKQSRFYQEVIEEGRQEGRQEEKQIMVQNFLLARFKEIDQELAAAIPALLRLADDRLAEALLQWSREEFLALARQSEPQE